jgi:hypothetical protein
VGNLIIQPDASRRRVTARLTLAVMPLRKLIPLAVVSGAALLAALVGPSRCPVELGFMKMEPAEIVASDGTKMYLVDLRVVNRQPAAVEFRDPVHCEAKVANHWVEAPDTWTIHSIAGFRPRRKAPAAPDVMLVPSAAEVTLLVPADATACRFRLEYRYLGRRPLPLGIGDPWARWEAPSLAALRVQQVTARISRPLYNWLWPASAPSPRAAPPGPWRRITAKAEFPNS